MENVSESFKDKTVLVTGGAGAIDGNLVQALNELDTKKIIILDNLSSSYPWNIPQGPKIQFIHGDILNDKNPNDSGNQRCSFHRNGPWQGVWGIIMTRSAHTPDNLRQRAVN